MLPPAGQNWLSSSMPAPDVDHMFKGSGKENRKRSPRSLLLTVFTCKRIYGAGFSTLSLCTEVGMVVIMITLLVTAAAGPPEALELCCMLTMSPLVCSGSARLKIFLIVA